MTALSADCAIARLPGMQRKFELTQVDGPCGTKLLLKKHTCNKAIYDRITLSVTIALLILFARVRALDMSDLFASIVATYQAVGSLFRPLRSPDDVAAFIDLEAGLPQDMPHHDERLHEGLQQAGAEYEGGAWALGQLRERMQQWPLLQRVIERLSLAPKRSGKVVLIFYTHRRVSGTKSVHVELLGVCVAVHAE